MEAGTIRFRLASDFAVCGETLSLPKAASSATPSPAHVQLCGKRSLLAAVSALNDCSCMLVHPTAGERALAASATHKGGRELSVNGESRGLPDAEEHPIGLKISKVVGLYSSFYCFK